MLLKLLGLPVTLPVAGIKFCLQQVLNVAEAEYYDEGPVVEALQLLSLRLEEGEITEDEFAAQEAILHRRLREIRAYKDRKLHEPLAARGQAPAAAGADGGDAARLGARARAVVEVAPLDPAPGPPEPASPHE
jgi:hypothetical protein